MSERDVQKGEIAAALALEENARPRRSGVVMRITSPWAILVTLPTFVLLVGALLTLATFTEMRAFARAEALESFVVRARSAERNVAASLSQADGLLDRLRELAGNHSSDAELAPFAVRLRDLALRRPGLKWLSVSFPDGGFQGVYVQPDGRIRLSVSRVVGSRTEGAHYDFEAERLKPVSHDLLSYDPRERSFYRLAVAARRRVWTEPYPFFPDFGTGITRTEALFDPGGSLRAVITADFDLNALSTLLEDPGTGVRLVAFTTDGAILAMNQRGGAPERPPSALRGLNFSDLEDATLQQFFATRPAPATTEPREVTTSSGSYLAVERPIRSTPDLTWWLGALVHEDVLWARASRQVRRSVASIALLVVSAVAVAGILALGVSRLRADRKQAEVRAEKALLEARDLGSYRLEERIGSGGMGEVWRARHRMLARPAAVKLIRTDLPGLDASDLEARFEREAFTLASMRSPHTVSLLDYGKAADGRLYLAMELLEGMTLDQVVDRHGPLSAPRVISILIGVCRSLAEAHAAGLVHRDIKPANIFLCHDGDGIERTKVIDFGLAKQPVAPALTAAGTVTGTTDYMAPEQARAEPIDGRADLYSLACVGFYLLTGRPVFRANSDVGVIIAHQTQRPPPLHEATTEWVPPELENLLTRCLAKDPAYRPRGASGLARALAEIPIPEAHRPSAESLRSWWERVAA